MSLIVILGWLHFSCKFHQLTQDELKPRKYPLSFHSHHKLHKSPQIRYSYHMKSKLTFLFSLTFLFLFSGSVYGEEPEVKKEYWDNGNLKTETHYQNGKKEGLETDWYESGEKKRERLFKNGEREGLVTLWFKSGKKEKVPPSS